MIRILHIIHTLTRSDGLSHFIMNYYRNLNRDKIQFDIICFRSADEEYKKEIETLGGHCYLLSEPDLSFRYYKEANDFFQAHKGEYTAVHCHALFAGAFYSSIAKKNGIKTIILHSHSNNYGKGLTRKIRNYLLIKLAKIKATDYMACSKSAAIFMFGNKALESNKVKIVYNAIPVSSYKFSYSIRQSTRSELDISKDQFVLGHVGSFAKTKNHDFIINTFAEICNKNSRSVLLLIGDDGVASGSTKKDIIDKVDKFGIKDKVKFLGIRNDINALMMSMDGFIFPSLFEGLGLVLVEAQATGLNCFASTNVPYDAKCTDLVEFIELDKGPKYWADLITSKTIIDREKIDDCSKMKKYDIKYQVDSLEQYYLSL